MAEKRLGDYSLTFEQALAESVRLQRREFETPHKPNILSEITWVLKDGPQAYKAAKYLTIRDQHTGEIHHNSLTIETLKRYKSRNEWVVDEKHTITITDEDEDEIGKLLKGLSSAPQIGGQGDLSPQKLYQAE